MDFNARTKYKGFKIHYEIKKRLPEIFTNSCYKKFEDRISDTFSKIKYIMNCPMKISWPTLKQSVPYSVINMQLFNIWC